MIRAGEGSVVPGARWTGPQSSGGRGEPHFPHNSSAVELAPPHGQPHSVTRADGCGRCASDAGSCVVSVTGGRLEGAVIAGSTPWLVARTGLEWSVHRQYWHVVNPCGFTI